jgi:hypothetical protein
MVFESMEFPISVNENLDSGGHLMPEIDLNNPIFWIIIL